MDGRTDLVCDTDEIKCALPCAQGDHRQHQKEKCQGRDQGTVRVAHLQSPRWHTEETRTAQDNLQGRQWEGILFHHQQFQNIGRPGGTRLQAPVDDRTALQTDQAELPVELFLGRKRERHPHPNLLCPHCTSAHGGDRQKSRNQKIVHQHPHRGATAHHELCGTFCVFKRHLQGMEEFAQPTAGQQVGH